MLRFISTRATTELGLPFSDAVRAGDILYLSGQLGNHPGTMTLAVGGIAGETRQMMTNIARVLEQNGQSFDDVFRCFVMLADMGDWRAFNDVYVPYFKPGRLPARSAFGANGLALGARVEMEVWAWTGEK
ncbi:MAG: RidA family protein [Rhizomicrobium sp.]